MNPIIVRKFGLPTSLTTANFTRLGTHSVELLR